MTVIIFPSIFKHNFIEYITNLELFLLIGKEEKVIFLSRTYRFFHCRKNCVLNMAMITYLIQISQRGMNKLIINFMLYISVKV